jgi:hypothetical protein
MSWRCRKCQSTSLLITALTEVLLVQREDDYFETEDYGGHEWTGNSPCRCRSCGHSGEVDHFDEDLPE